MASYGEIIQAQCSRMNRSINWWPRYLYHFTDVNHAVSIIDSEWIYDRVSVEAKHLAKTDAASHNVLNVTGDEIKHCGRLYMRPLTPTQFYSEGYKPKSVRHERYKDANCPALVFFLLDTVKTLELPGMFFVECGAAGHYTQAQKSGPDEYAKLRFDKIFHHGPTGQDTSILKYRRTEVLREGGIPLRGLLKRIVCRSPAEKNTLLSLMHRRCPTRYEEYSRYVMTASADVGMYLFNRNGIYIKAAKAQEEYVLLEFNEASLRYDFLDRERKGPVAVEFSAVLSWKNLYGQIISNSVYHGALNYKTHNALTLSYGTKLSDYFTLEFCFEGHLVFQGDFYIGNQGVVY